MAFDRFDTIHSSIQRYCWWVKELAENYHLGFRAAMLWRALRSQSGLPSRQKKAAERSRSCLKRSGPGMGSGMGPGMDPGMGPGEEHAQMMVIADASLCCGVGLVQNQVLKTVAEQPRAGLDLISHQPAATLDLFVFGLATWRVERRHHRRRRIRGN